MNTKTITSASRCWSSDRPRHGWDDRVVPDHASVEVAVAWNGIVQDVVHRRTDSEDPWIFYLGEEPTCQFPVPAEALAGATKLPFVEIRDGVVTLHVPPGASGELVGGDGVGRFLDRDAGAGRCALPLGPRSQATVELGPWTFRVRSSQPAAKFVAPLEINWSGGTFLGISAALHLVFFLLVYLVPPSASGLNLDSNTVTNRFSKYFINPPEARLQETPDTLRSSDDGRGKAGQRHAGPEGAAGDRRAPKTGKRYGLKGPSDNREPHMKKHYTKEMVTKAGVLGALSAIRAPTSPFGRDTALGNDPENALGALLGPEIGASSGYGGLGVYSTGRGGGGNGEGTIGVGPLGRIGDGYGKFKKGWPGGRPQSPMKDRVSKSPVVGVSTGGSVTGSLSKAVIRRHVRRHISEIKHCYEKGLARQPDISGRVAVQFIIDSNGAVNKAVVRSTTLNEPGVEACIARTVRRMTFPMPKDGGIVVVTYPFTLMTPGI